MNLLCGCKKVCLELVADVYGGKRHKVTYAWNSEFSPVETRGVGLNACLAMLHQDYTI